MIITKTGITYDQRSEMLRRLAAFFSEKTFRDELISAYTEDTAFIYQDILKREIETPAQLLSLPRNDQALRQQKPLGTVAVLVPKNSLGLTLAKAVAGSFLMGNHTRVYFPGQLKNTAPVYSRLFARFLPGVEMAPPGMSSTGFLRTSLKDPDVAAVVIYGDDAWIDAYRNLAEETATKVIFEGPGNDPIIVMPDADLDSAVDGALAGGLNNGGQSCSAFERFFVHTDIADAFRDRLVQQLSLLKTGSPRDPATRVGPIASRIIFSRILRQLEEAVSLGARLDGGGEVLTEPETGLPILLPAVLSECRPDMQVVARETFGPVFPLIRFSGMADLMPALDATSYGLNASVYGSCEPSLLSYLRYNYRNVYEDSTCVCPQNIASRMLDGGFKRSGFVWEQQCSYITRTGQRYLAYELSR